RPRRAPAPPAARATAARRPPGRGARARRPLECGAAPGRPAPMSTPASDAGAEAPSYPGARPPDRRRDVDSAGLRIAVWEWGDPDAPPLLLAHGGFDFARTFDVFAPLLADGGWRVVSWDQRGHGDSEHAALYNWDADARD